MKIKRALIVYKKSSYQKQVLEEKSSYFRKLMRQQHVSVRDWVQLHEEHVETIHRVQTCLKHHGIPYQAYHRFAIKTPIRADLIITVGGDGTFLEAAHYARKELMFGVNSTPSASVGHFAAATAKTFEKKFQQVMTSKFRKKTLQRLQAYKGRIRLGPPVLNEILFTSQNAGATSRYWIRKMTGQKKGAFEEQKSSGIWIATPAGSSAAIHSAGGKRLPMEAIKFSYRVRELYQYPGTPHRIHSGTLGPRDALQITVKMDDGALFLDGAHVMFPVRRGEMVTVRLSKVPLHVVG